MTQMTQVFHSLRTPNATHWQRTSRAPHRRRWHLPNEDAIIRIVGVILLEQNDEWAVQRARYIALETMALMSDDLGVSCRPW
jgi:hypothetical protein